MSTNHGGPHVTVAKEGLDRPDIVIGLQQMVGKTMVEGLGGDALGKLGQPDPFSLSHFL